MIHTVMLVGALICFLLAVPDIKSRVNFLALGLVMLTLSMLLNY